jgi:hypothetical protein
MKKIFVPTAIALVLALAGCAGRPEPVQEIKPPEPTVRTYPPQIIEHKGTSFGVDIPGWVSAALSGKKAVERLPDYAGKYVIVIMENGADLQGTQLAAARMGAQAQLAALLSTQVKDYYVSAQAGDKNKLEDYQERAVKSVAEATFTGFTMENEWWMKRQNFDQKGKKSFQDYQVIQVWDIDRSLLNTQIERVLSDAAGRETSSENKQKAMDMVEKLKGSDFDFTDHK